MSDNPGWDAWRHNFNTAYLAYVLAALWLAFCNGHAQHADPSECRGDQCDAGLWDIGYGPEDLAPGAVRDVEEDLYNFVTSCLAERPDCFDTIPPDMVGHDFYLTRCGHGRGFWDRGLGDLGKWLTGMAETFGEASIHVGDDGHLYH